MALSQEELFKLDLYDILGLEVKCSLQEVKRAFRKKALKCHPDKNPDDPNAAQLFHQLSCALEILSDESARAAYDKVLNARKAAVIRNQQLDSRRKKLKEDLEERERNANRLSANFKNEELKLKAEIERLRKEGSRLLQEEISKVKEQIDKAQEHINSFEYTKSEFSESEFKGDSGSKCFTVRWKVEREDADNAGYSYDVLRRILSKYGEISTLILSAKRRGRAVVEFKTCDASIHQMEIGLPGKPLTIESVKGADPPKKFSSSSSDSSARWQNESVKKSSVFPSFSAINNQPRTDDLNTSKWSLGKNSPRERDEMLENTVLQRLRDMERMKRAAEEKTADK